LIDIVGAVEAGVRAYEYMRINHESPWISLQEVFKLKLDIFSITGIRKDPTRDLVVVKSFPSSINREKKE